LGEGIGFWVVYSGVLQPTFIVCPKTGGKVAIVTVDTKIGQYLIIANMVL